MMLRITIFFLFCSLTLSAQKVKVVDEHSRSPSATLQEISWIAGHWEGDLMGNKIEEIWTEPLGGSMMGSFRMAYEDQVRFYEIMTITPLDSSLILKIKHFNADLTGWEEKDETVDFPLVELNQNTAFFSGLTFEKVSDNQLNIYVNQESDGETHEVKFTYFKQ